MASTYQRVTPSVQAAPSPAAVAAAAQAFTPPILALPEEIRTLIAHELGRRDAKSYRLVCRQFAAAGARRLFRSKEVEAVEAVDDIEPQYCTDSSSVLRQLVASKTGLPSMVHSLHLRAPTARSCVRSSHDLPSVEFFHGLAAVTAGLLALRVLTVTGQPWETGGLEQYVQEVLALNRLAELHIITHLPPEWPGNLGPDAASSLVHLEIPLHSLCKAVGRIMPNIRILHVSAEYKRHFLLPYKYAEKRISVAAVFPHLPRLLHLKLEHFVHSGSPALLAVFRRYGGSLKMLTLDHHGLNEKLGEEHDHMISVREARKTALWETVVKRYFAEVGRALPDLERVRFVGAFMAGLWIQKNKEVVDRISPVLTNEPGGLSDQLAMLILHPEDDLPLPFNPMLGGVEEDEYMERGTKRPLGFSIH